MGRHEEAIAILKKAIARNPNYLIAHLNLVLAYSRAGQEEEARAEAAEVLQLNPNFSLETISQTIPQKDPAVLERALDAWRKAGLK